MTSFVEENHLLRGGYAKISTDDRGLYFFTEGRRPKVKKYNPRSEVDHLSITTDKEVVFLYNFRSPPPLPNFFFSCKKKKNKIYLSIINSEFCSDFVAQMGRQLSWRSTILVSLISSPTSITFNISTSRVPYQLTSYFFKLMRCLVCYLGMY